MQKWDEYGDRFSRVTDRIGLPIDSGIFDTVVALNVLGIHTTASCEGHLDHGNPYPWVEVGIPTTFVRKDPPEIQQLIERLIELRREQDKDIEMQQLQQVEAKERLQPRYKLFGYLTEFYKKREVPFDRIIISRGFIMSQGGDFLDLLEGRRREQKLHEYQDEMRAFTEFLKKIIFDD